MSDNPKRDAAEADLKAGWCSSPAIDAFVKEQFEEAFGPLPEGWDEITLVCHCGKEYNDSEVFRAHAETCTANRDAAASHAQNSPKR